MSERNHKSIARLRELWATGESASKIGAAMGISKNAVVGKAHRLNLPSRPSCIIRDGKPRAPKVERLSKPGDYSVNTVVPVERVRELAAQPAPDVVRAPRNYAAKPCAWPIGHPGTAEFHFCAGHAEPGRPYCADHVAIAYVRKYEAREVA